MTNRQTFVNGLNIYVDQLKNGNVEKIQQDFTPEFLEIKDKDLIFEDQVSVDGEAYVTEGNLLLYLDISTVAILPCSICNSSVKVPILIKKLYHAVPLSDIKGAIYSMKDLIREGILLETPTFAECNQGQCPQRKDLEKYFHKSSPENEGNEMNGYRPFEGLNSDKFDEGV